MNVAAYSAIQRCGGVHYVGPINPPISFNLKIYSKLCRFINAPGAFYFFSAERLQAIAKQVVAKRNSEARLDFFHGFTPWIYTRPESPYVAWSDCTFADYISIYHAEREFCVNDLVRIKESEANWLSRATKVLFTSHWAAKRAIQSYSLDPEKVEVVGIFGELPPPAYDEYNGRSNFLFVSTDFHAKGGHIVAAAFQKLKLSYPQASLTIIGDSPANSASYQGVNFVGFLKKENPSDLTILKHHLAQARVLVHPTQSDISPLIIVEAGYFGCPVVSSRRFAIPELVTDGENGFLLDDPSDVDAVLAVMKKFLADGLDYKRMREFAWMKSHNSFSKSSFCERLARAVTSAVEQQ